MNDLISRQAAMAFPLSWEHRDKEHGSDEFISGVECYRDYIGGLPSAQMDLPCVGCRYERKGSVVCDDCSRFFMDRYERRAEE